jgi:glycosyltransferase involved in cell wall biosynthesis
MMQALPFISVIVPIFNRREYVRQLLGSLQHLSYPHDRFEVLVVDNGSTDGAWEEACSMSASADFPLRCFRNPSDLRVPSASRNYGVAQATGEIVAFTDSDCTVSPQWLSAATAAFAPGVGIVYGRTVADANAVKPILHHTLTVDSRKTYAETCNIFYLRDLVVRAGGFDESLASLLKGPVWGEDTDLAYRVLELGYRGVFCGDAIVVHKVVPSSFRSWLLEPLRAGPWARVVKRHPRIRKDLLFNRIFCTRMTALFDLMLTGALLSLAFGWPFLILLIPFLAAKYAEGGHQLSFGMRIARLVGGSVRAFLLFCTLMYSSLRYRSLVL